jgi:hypothetical protein
MKNAVVTVCMGDGYKSVGEVSHPFMKEYADKIGAEFIVFDDQSKKFQYPKNNKFLINELFVNGYDRILYVDTDVLIKRDSPNIFDIVPEDSFGIRRDPTHGPILAFKKYLRLYDNELTRQKLSICDVCWDGEHYYNSGVMCCSSSTNIFKWPPVAEISLYGIKDQHYINRCLLLADFDVFELSGGLNKVSPKNEQLMFDCCRTEEFYFLHFISRPPDDIVKQMKMVISDLYEGFQKGESDVFN